MSRSRKRNAVFTTQSRERKFYKRLAHTRNRMLERMGIYLSSRQCRHLVDSWDICDYKYIAPPGSELYEIARRK